MTFVGSSFGQPPSSGSGGNGGDSDGGGRQHHFHHHFYFHLPADDEDEDIVGAHEDPDTVGPDAEFDPDGGALHLYFHLDLGGIGEGAGPGGGQQPPMPPPPYPSYPSYPYPYPSYPPPMPPPFFQPPYQQMPPMQSYQQQQQQPREEGGSPSLLRFAALRLTPALENEEPRAVISFDPFTPMSPYPRPFVIFNEKEAAQVVLLFQRWLTSLKGTPPPSSPPSSPGDGGNEGNNTPPNNDGPLFF